MYLLIEVNLRAKITTKNSQSELFMLTEGKKED